MQLVERLDEVLRAASEADAPAGHGIGLGAAVHGQRAVAQPRFDLDDGGGLEAVIGQLFVDVVGEDPHIRVAQQHVADRAQLFSGIGRTGRVAGVVEQEPLGLRRDRRFQVFRAQLEAVVLAAGDQHRGAVGERHDIGVADPGRGRDDHLITLIERGDHGVEDHLLAAGGDDDFFRLVVQAAIDLELVRDGLAQSEGAGDVGIARVAGLDGGDGGVFDELGGVEIRFALGQHDDIPAGRFHRPRLGRNGDGHGGGDAVEAFGGQGHDPDFRAVENKKPRTLVRAAGGGNRA